MSLNVGFERRERIYVAECSRQTVSKRWASLRKRSFTKYYCVYPRVDKENGRGKRLETVWLVCKVEDQIDNDEEGGGGGGEGGVVRYKPCTHNALIGTSSNNCICVSKHRPCTRASTAVHRPTINTTCHEHNNYIDGITQHAHVTVRIQCTQIKVSQHLPMCMSVCTYHAHTTMSPGTCL